VLDAPWCDLDQQIAERAGMSVAAIFDRDGEAGFRALERDAMATALDQPPQVIAAGGGWAAEPGNLARAELRALTIYLSIDPADAAGRLGASHGRPLLEGGPVEERLRSLLAERERWYLLAAIEIAVGRASIESAASAVATAARQYGGWSNAL